MTIFAFWQPIILSGLLVFIASAAIRMVMPWHRTDYKTTGGAEEAIRSARKDLPPGTYLVPHCIDPEEFEKP